MEVDILSTSVPVAPPGADPFGLAAQDNTLGRCILDTDKIPSNMSGYCEKASSNKASSKGPLVYPFFLNYLFIFLCERTPYCSVALPTRMPNYWS